MRNRIALSLALGAALALPASAFADAVAVATTKPVNEVPSVITDATGTFTATVSATSIKYKYTISGLTGKTLFAHIHVGQQFTNGGVAVFLCNSSGAGPTAQDCPQGSGTITGTLTAADVIGPSGQGVSAQDFQGLLDAIAEGAAYVNIHTDVFPGGESRGQIVQIGKVAAQ